MRPITRTFIAGLALAASTGLAAAQDVIITPEQDVIIRDYLVKEGPVGGAVPEGYDIVVGSTLPEVVEIRPLAVDKFDRQYDYAVLDGRTVLIDPATRRVVYILD